MAPSPTKRKDRSDEKSRDRSKDKGATKESSEKDRGRDETRKRRSASSGSSSTRSRSGSTSSSGSSSSSSSSSASSRSGSSSTSRSSSSSSISGSPSPSGRRHGNRRCSRSKSEPPKRDEKERKRRSPSPKPTKVHIGRLTRNVTKDHIMEILSTYGKIKMIDMPVERMHPHLAKGYAYVEFENPDEAEKALEHMDGGQIDGQEITATAVLAPWPRPPPRRFSPPRRMLPPPPRWRRSPPRMRRRSRAPQGNTVSNLIMIIPPIFGAIQSVRDGLEKRYIASYLALTVVGMGSWCFHMTLKYEMQLAKSNAFGNGFEENIREGIETLGVDFKFECFKMKNSVNYHLLFILVLFSLIVTTVYLKVKEPIFHQVMYGVLVFTLVLRSIYIVTWNFRKKVPPIIGVTTQFHAWWHILTGLGSYLHILFRYETLRSFLQYPMASPCRRSLNPKPLTLLLVGVSFLALHLWLLQASRSQRQKMWDGSTEAAPAAPAAVQPSAFSSGSPCVANDSVNATVDFEQLPARIQDFLRYRHCRHFPLLWDAPAKCAGRRGVFLLLAVKSSPANYDRRELIRRTRGQERRYHGRQVRRLFLLGSPAREDAESAGRLAALVELEAREHGDMLQWAFTDTFLNLTLKHLHLLDWLAGRGPHARFLLSCDDDVFVHTANVLHFLGTQRPERHLFAGQLMDGSVPIRDSGSKYFVPPQLFPGEAYRCTAAAAASSCPATPPGPCAWPPAAPRSSPSMTPPWACV
ncbi:hypothetical protein GH733_001587 [Mirounga leonina]|nr:hypothetical protein GH733_001587 [Mirounga leonina]